MPPLEQMDRYDTVVVWPKTGSDRYDDPVLGTAVEVLVRFNRKRRDVLRPDGTVLTLDGDLVADRDLAVGSLLYDGDADSLPGTGTGTPDGDYGLYQVVDVERTRSICGKYTFWGWMVQRYMGTIPTPDYGG